MLTLRIVNMVITIIFTLCYSYQFLYTLIIWFRRRKKEEKPATPQRYAVMICARNEEAVIADLIGCLRAQTYDASLLHVFVMADNCTDGTAAVSRAAGATVYERHNLQHVGKGYGLNALMQHLQQDYPARFDGYFVFDADNLLEPDFIEQMNRTLSQGYDIVTSYRNSKNFGDNWISAGYSLWFLRDSRYLNHARHLLGSSCSVTGTGFAFSRAVAEDIGAWPYHTLTEDIEFSIDQMLKGHRIAFCADAILYDEQPTGFRQSWRQRLRWCKGYFQVFRLYGKQLLRGMARGRFDCFDLSMSILPAYFLSALSILCNVILGVWGAAIGDDVGIAFASIGQFLLGMYLMLLSIGAVTTVTEWKRIHAAPVCKILYLFTMPLFIFTYIPIAMSAPFCRVQWKPITHSISAQQLRQKQEISISTAQEAIR